MANTSFREYTEQHGGRVIVLFLLFLLAMHLLTTSGLPAFAALCLSPLLIFVVVFTFGRQMMVFWSLVVINYIIMWKNISLPIPTSLPNEMLELLLLVLAILNIKESRFERAGNVMFLSLSIWCAFCTLEVLNDTCGIGIDVAAWYAGARLMAFQLMYGFLVFTLYISNAKTLKNYLVLWAILSLFAVIWVWKQKTFGFTEAENAWIQTRGRTTHIIAGGSLIRYFSIFNDAASFGIGIAASAVAFLIFGFTSRVKKFKYLFLAAGLGCSWAIFPSGTRTAIVCLMAGIIVYVFLSKSFKIAVPITIVFTLMAFLLIFTTVGDGNQQIRRMRSAFDKDDASANQRSINQEAMKKYMKEAPWGISLAVGYQNAPANNKYTFMAKVPPDSEYVFIWIHTGVIGITIFLITTLIMWAGACWIVLFRLKSPSLTGIGAGFCSAFVAMQLGGYGNQVLMQFPNCLLFYGGLAIVYVLPYLEEEWISFEEEQLAIEAEKKRIKEEKKRAKRLS